ncbi:MAG: 50S ribosomal protein L18 [bacterium]
MKKDIKNSTKGRSASGRKRLKRIIRHRRTRKKITGSTQKPRLTIFRSNRYIYAQLIDDRKSVTLASCNDKDTKKEKETAKKIVSPAELTGKVRTAYLVGLKLAKSAKKIGFEEVVFDRGGYKYHGRVKAVAEGARAGGLKF